MTAALLRDVVEIKGRFHRSVQLARDWQQQADLDGYVLTPTVRDLSLRLVGEMHGPAATRAWSITGPYGSGKSAFALFLADLFAHDPPKHSGGRALRQEAGPHVPNLLPILVVGQRAPMKPAILTALAEGLEDTAPSLARKVAKSSRFEDPTDDQVIAFVVRANEAVRKAGWDGLLITLDEFGKFLEYAALHPDTEDLFVMQRLAEMVARDPRPTLLITLLHTAFSDYLLPTVDEARKAEWRKVQGRFADVAFQEPPEQLLRLIGAAITRRLPAEAESTYSSLVDKALTSPALAEAGRRLPLMELLPDCLPLDPVVAMLLWPLFRSKLAQNERSLFAFLAGEEPFGFREFLTITDLISDCPALYRVDRLYDYVTTALGLGASRGEAARRWTEVEQALDRVDADAPVATRGVVKAIGLLSMYGNPVGLKASKEALSLALDDSGVEDALAYLERASIVVYRRYEDSYGLWEGSDVDLNARFEEAIERLDRGRLAERLQRAVTLRPVVARAHYIETGTLRYFDVGLVDGNEEALRQALEEEVVADGRISFVLCRPQDRPGLVRLGEELTREAPRDDRLRVLAFPDPLVGLEEGLEEVEGWERVNDEVSALQGDPVARKELQARREHAQHRLEKIAGRILGLRGHRFDPASSTWVQNGASHDDIVSARQFSRWLSKLCDRVYDRAPELHNELLNRERLSSAAAAGRRNLLQAMIENEGHRRLRLEGTPAEASMYESMLASGGFHREREGGWRFGEPNPFWRPVWDAIEEFLDSARDGRRPIQDLFALLKAPPFGVREGPLPVLLCAAVLANRDNIALYEQDVFVPEPGIELFERLLRVPEAFSVRRFALTDQDRKALEAVGGAVGALRPEARRGAGTDVLQVVRPLVMFAARLPAYAKHTKRVDPPQAVALREALLRAKDPYDLLFSDVPEALDVRPDEVERLAWTLRDCVVGLQQAYPRLLEHLEGQLREAFDLRGSSEEARSQLRARATPLVGFASGQALGVFVREAARLEERDWREALARTLVNGMPPEQWRDRDRTTFDVRLREVASGFVRLEELVIEKRRSGAEDAQVLRIGILNGRVREARALIAVDSDRAPAVEDLAGRIAEALDEGPELGEEGRRVRLAALARVAMEHLRVDGEEDG